MKGLLQNKAQNGSKVYAVNSTNILEKSNIERFE